MTKQKTSNSKSRQRYSDEYKAEALALAQRIGVSDAARQLGLHESQLYNWRSKARLAQDRGETEQQLAQENARLKRQLAEQAEELAGVKKSGGVLRQKCEVRYAFMHSHTSLFRVTCMARALQVSRSGYYVWLHRQKAPSLRRQRQQSLDIQVGAAFDKAKKRNGAPRLTKDLAQQGVQANRKTVARSMQRLGLRAKAARKFKATTHSRHSLPVAENLLQQDFNATEINQKWAGDITYLWTEEGWLYLAVVLDLFSRKVIGWAMSKRMKSELVCDALRMALWRRRQPKGVIVHSDRGSQYCSEAYQTLIQAHGLRCSMSGKGNCYDNACVESFFHSLKVEAIHGERYATRQEMREAVFEYIEVDYNRIRLHSANGYLSPESYEASKVA
ncbi:IS3 family transposase [Hahella aquimaris]|nr:IS3 family transposase [Hahella sp. HNIBRBA332]WLQ15626.1 IS3 family transposase [Hahella sp. HNIBRBA332]